MFRLFIIVLFLNLSIVVLGQTSKRVLKYRAQQNIEQEDYIEASKYYDSIVQRDSADYQTLKTYSEILIKTKYFVKADLILKKIISLSNKQINKQNSLIQLAYVNKQLGKYKD
jgi:thioredoxin-like negative regulator of GroEL